MYCRNCGKQIDDNAVVCPECGAKTGVPEQRPAAETPRAYCKNCGKEVDPKAVVCPHCGVQINAQKEKKPVNSLGIAGFIVSLVSVIAGSTFVVPLVGLILSAIGVAQREKYSSSGFATAGLIISIVTLVFWVLMIVLLAVGVFSGFFDALFDAIYGGQPPYGTYY